MLGLADGDRCITGDACAVASAAGSSSAREHFVHQTPGVSFAAVRAAGQDQLLGAALADGARQGLRAAAAGHDAERHLGQREARILGRVEKSQQPAISQPPP